MNDCDYKTWAALWKRSAKKYHELYSLHVDCNLRCLNPIKTLKEENRRLQDELENTTNTLAAWMARAKTAEDELEDIQQIAQWRS